MKKYIAIAALALLTAPVIAQQYDPKTPFQVKTLSSDNIAMVDAKTFGGNISLESVEGSNARIEVYIWPGNGRDRDITREEIQKRLDQDYELTIKVEGHTLNAWAKAKDGFKDWKHSLNISYRIYLPKSASSLLRTSGGNISITGMNGPSQDFATSGGNLNVDGLTGTILGKTSGGNIHVKNTSDNIELSTSGGNISAENTKGQIHLSTSGGNLSLEDLAGTIDANTSGGSVHAARIDGSLSTKTSGGNLGLTDLTCSLDASTSGGNIDVSINKTGKFITLRNSSGNIALRMPADVGMDLKIHAEKIKINKMNNFNGTTEEHSIVGTLNGGGIPVTVDNGGGHFALTLR